MKQTYSVFLFPASENQGIEASLADEENVPSMTPTIIPNQIGVNTHNPLVPNGLCN